MEQILKHGRLGYLVRITLRMDDIGLTSHWTKSFHNMWLGSMTQYRTPMIQSVMPNAKIYSP